KIEALGAAHGKNMAKIAAERQKIEEAENAALKALDDKRLAYDTAAGDKEVAERNKINAQLAGAIPGGAGAGAVGGGSAGGGGEAPGGSYSPYSAYDGTGGASGAMGSGLT